jgi:hypothetical protein
MHRLEWSGSEKKIARRAYEAAADVVLARALAEFKAKAAAATTPTDMWDVEDFLRRRRRELDELLDYRYSQLVLVFGRLIHEGYLDEAQLAGLAEDKLAAIRRYLSFMEERSSGA